MSTVSPEGSVEVQPGVVNSRRGETEALTCSSNGGPGNTFTWTRRPSAGSAVGNTSAINVTVGDASNGGMYECVVRNDAGNGSAITTINGKRNKLKYVYVKEILIATSGK